ncbi:CENP-Q, a CENPA-CAD centromere complex subunit-domain-containing protein [Stachybotrys elegans]|uniref:CENP-Q, a CENPA-CAD centromere complex subunit-domain-containing protein n=1 Tax=Stachybotrys elegans TaxID=80388 RepID=A0A8K0WRF5_9HYPO|nr:CENP-Q, a CENPA-CAD centromere complex subunit-domain-containing protein [Stachybotrys elegans]
MPPEPSRRKHGRPPPTTTEADASQNHDNETGEPDVDEQDRPRKRGRPSSKPAPPAGRRDKLPPSQRVRRRKRVHRHNNDEVAELQNPGDMISKQKLWKKTTSRRSNRAKEGEGPQPTLTTRTGRKKRGQKSTEKSKDTEVHAETAGQEEGPQRGKPSKKPSRSRTKAPKPGRRDANSARQSGGASEVPEEESRPAKRRRSSQSQRADESTVLPPSPAKPYVHVASRVRRIRQSTIQEKWTPLGGASLAVAADMLQLGQQPILQRLDSTQQRRGHASSALHLVAGRIMRKMRKGLPFPPASMAPSAARGEADAGRETELDFEKVLDARQALERRLDPSLHAVELLRREKERLERELERDYQALKALEVSARAQAREQRSLLKKAHVLAPEAKPASQRNPEPRLMLNHQHGDSAITSPFTDIEDTELQALALQLGGHAESISTNLQQVEGIVPQLSRSKAMLQDVLQRYLDASQYEQVVLG